MTTPNPFESSDNYTALRRRWFNRYLAVQKPVDKEVKRILIEAAESTSKKIEALGRKDTFSAATRMAQLNMTMREIKHEVKDIFGQIKPILASGSKEAAGAAASGMSASDRQYLSDAFGETGLVKNYLQIEENSARTGVQAAIARMVGSDIPLSRRVYNSNALANRWIQREVTIGILRGDSPKEIAASVRKHIRPDVPGGVSYAALRLARTEINNAFHATTIALAKDRPWVESMAWNLSHAHTETTNGRREICEIYASKEWKVEDVPRKPHPMCRCFVTPVLETPDVFIRHLTAGQYRDWIENAA